jgi:hypothetical protein
MSTAIRANLFCQTILVTNHAFLQQFTHTYIHCSASRKPDLWGWAGIEALVYLYWGLSLFKYTFWDIVTWSQGTPLTEVETVNDLKEDEQYTGIARL